MRTASLILLSLLFALSIAGCGDSSNDSNADDTTANNSSAAVESAAEENEGSSVNSGAVDQGAADSDAAATDASDAPDEAGPGSTAGTVVGDLAASVDGMPIPMAEFQRQAFETQRFYVEQGLDPNTDEGQRRLLFLRRQVLDDMINQLLVEQAAAALGVTATDDEVTQRMQIYVDEFGDEAALEASLADAGTTREEIEAMERAGIIGQKMLDEITADVPTTAQSVRARHILCNSSEACEEALARIEAGEAFETVARAVSEDTASAERGGDLDWITVGMLPSQQLEDEIFKLAVGDRSAVVATDFGFHVIEVVDQDDARELSEEQRLTLREKRLMDWLSDRKRDADIIIYIDDLRDLVPQ